MLGHGARRLGWAVSLLLCRPSHSIRDYSSSRLLTLLNWGIAAAPSAAAMMLLPRHLLPFLRAATSLPSPMHHSARLLPFLRASTPLPSPMHHCARLLATSPAPFSLEEYLVAACNLAPAQARKTVKKAFDESSKQKKKAFEDFSWSRLNSASNPQAIIDLLSGVGLSRADIAAVIVADPLLLRSSPKNIGPRLLCLRDRLGLSTPQIVSFLLVGSRSLRNCDISPRLEFFISFLGSFEKFIQVMKKTTSILWSDLERVVKPNIALLHQCGLSDGDITQLCSVQRSVLTFSPERVKEIVLRAEELGVPRSSRTFWRAVSVVKSNTKENIAARLKLLKSTLGCCESKISTTVSKMPSIVGLSEEYLQRKISFLINEVGLKPQYIVERPALFTLSLEKRMIPRHCVMKVLQEKGLLNSNVSFFRLIILPEKTFKLRFIDCYKDSLPGLADSYAAASAGVVPSKI